jgi:hypothetical protein
MSVLLTDHNVFETFTIADRVYIIHDGRVLKHGSPQELVADEDARRLYLGDKFAAHGEEFRRLRDEIEHKGRTTVRIGRTTRILRLEEAEHRRLQEVQDGPDAAPEGREGAETATAAPPPAAPPTGEDAPAREGREGETGRRRRPSSRRRREGTDRYRRGEGEAGGGERR